MKRVVVATQNTLVSEAIMHSLKERDILVEKSLSETPDGIAKACQTFLADVLFMDVTRFGSGSFDNRMKTINMVKKSGQKLETCFICDNVSDKELSFKIIDTKKLGFIDAFFYQSVPSDYIADVISAM